MPDTDVDTHVPGHSHVHPKLPPSREATVVLDIGDGVGALVVTTPPSLAGVEIEIAPRGSRSACMHTEVRERLLPEGTVYAGVFPAVGEGGYVLLDADGALRRELEIRSGRVTDVAW